MPTTPESLQQFVNYCQQYITGDEKGQAQIFLDRLFQAFGYEGALQAGATFEQRIEKAGKSGKMGFADLLWKNHVLIEMKKRGSDLQDREYRTQAERYYIRIKKSDRPRYVILCNFDEFHIYDFDNQPDDPVDMIALEDLPRRIPAFSFLEAKNLRPQFKNNQVEITEKAARRLGDVLHSLLERGERNHFKKYTPLQAQRFILQCVLAMYAEDIGLLPPAIFTRCLQDCLEDQENAYDILGGLFQAMNQTGVVPDGRYEGVDYFNGGLFQEIHPIKLEYGELNLLLACAGQDWSKVRPSIFGNLFEGALNYTDKTQKKSQQQRHAHGIHFTSEADIRSIVLPTLREYWENRISEANTLNELKKLYRELIDYKILDPACGSGNFLYVAYQELKYIEKILFEKIANFEDISGYTQKVSPQQFYGMDINAFAVELAKVTLMIGRKVAIDKLGLNEPSLPLDTLEQNIICIDALFTEWVKADAIIGNPPFLGGKKLRSALGDEYVEKLKQKFPEVEGQPDFCVFWFRKTADILGKNGRSGLVGTNSISQITGRKASLDYVVEKGGMIYNAISTQHWSGDANVHVSIVNWSKEKPLTFDLDGQQVSYISTALKSEIAVNTAQVLLANKNRSFEGCQLAGKGFIIDEETAQDWIKKDRKNQDVLKIMVDGKGLIYPFSTKDWVIDFNNMSIEEASEYELPFATVREKVKPEREESREKLRKEKWWLLSRPRPAMRKALQGLSCYFAIPKIVKYIMFTPVDISILPCEANMVIASDDYYILGILTSNLHRIWVKAQSSTLEDRTRYTNTTCFETFPFPQNPDQKIVEKIRKTAIDLQEYRSQEMQKKGWGITQLYNQYYPEPASKLYKLHQKLDQLVIEAYGFKPEDNLLEKLLELNQECAEKEKRGEVVLGAVAPDF
ncbi:class I SAM-dependent DNA methyltransferase [Planktothrix sp.]|uniref:class I SAM-dependent DNA methyltransferase n=1 Tax=Planktothrix sp. TaxID=3088171 RepID=UPI0038D434D7